MTERFPFHFSLSCIGERNGNPLQCSCLENPRDRGTWWASVYGVAQSWTQLKRLSSSSSNMYRHIKAFLMAQKVKKLPAMQETGVWSQGLEDPRTWQPIPVFLPGESHGQRSLVGYSPWGCKESDTTEQLSTYKDLLASESWDFERMGKPQGDEERQLF